MKCQVHGIFGLSIYQQIYNDENTTLQTPLVAELFYIDCYEHKCQSDYNALQKNKTLCNYSGSN